jgi:hypothetical protein
MSAPKVEQVQSGEKGAERYRSDKRVKRFLLAKRPEVDSERLINYRTECCVACHAAAGADAAADIQAFLLGEYQWAVRELAIHKPAVLKSLGYPERYWKHAEEASPQTDLFSDHQKAGDQQS